MFFTGICICQKLPNYTLRICVFYYIPSQLHLDKANKSKEQKRERQNSHKYWQDEKMYETSKGNWMEKNEFKKAGGMHPSLPNSK